MVNKFGLLTVAEISVLDPETDPYYLAGSGSVSDDTDPDPGSA